MSWLVRVRDSIHSSRSLTNSLVRTLLAPHSQRARSIVMLHNSWWKSHEHWPWLFHDYYNNVKDFLDYCLPNATPLAKIIICNFFNSILFTIVLITGMPLQIVLFIFPSFVAFIILHVWQCHFFAIFVMFFLIRTCPGYEVKGALSAYRCYCLHPGTC